MQAGGLDQIDLVDANQWADAPFFGGDQQTIDQMGLQPRLGGAGNDGQLIDVGDQDLLPPSHRAADAALPRLDPLNDPLTGVAVRDRAKLHPVAGRHDVALIGSERLEQPPGGTLDDLAGFGLDRAD